MDKKIGKYTLHDEISRGGMGIVFRATDEQLQRQHAIKMLPKEFFSNKEQKDRFLLEARIIAKLDHPNIMKVYAFEEAEETVWIVMELLEGKPLSSVIKEKGKIPIPEVSVILDQLSKALFYAHSKGIVHRDIKPQNVMVNGENVVKLMDFGIAKETESDLHLTKAGTIMGTPKYMSPEQFTGEGVDKRSDIYSLGIMTFEMLCGKVPFDGKTLPEIAYKHIHEALPSVRKQCPGIPPALEKFIISSLAKKKADRLATLDSLDLTTSQGAIAKTAKAKILVYRAAFGVLFLFILLAAVSFYLNTQQQMLENQKGARELMRFSEKLIQGREWLKAKGKLTQALALLPDDPEIKMKLEEVQKIENREENRNKAQSVFSEGLKFLSNGETDKFDKNLKEAELLDPEAKEQFEKKAKEGLFAFRKSKALQLYSQAIGLMEGGDEATFNEKLKEASTLDPEGNYEVKGMNVLSDMKLRKSQSACDEGIQKMGNSDFDAAEAKFLDALKFNPKNAKAYAMLADNIDERSLSTGKEPDFKSYCEDLEKSLEIDPQTEEIWYKLAVRYNEWAVKDAGKKNEAKDACKRGLKYFPGSVNLTNLLKTLGES